MSSRRSMTRDIHESIRLLLGKNVKILLKAPVKLELRGGDKTENRILVFTAHRLFIMTAKVPTRIDHHFHYLDLRQVESKRSSNLTLTFQSAGDKTCAFSFRPNEETSPNADTAVDDMIVVLVSAIRRVFPGVPVENVVGKMDIQPSDRRCLGNAAWKEPDSKLVGPCGGFSAQYSCLCDYYALPFREEVAWDVDTIYFSHDSHEMCLQDFEHLDHRDLLCIISALEHNAWFTKLKASGNNAKLSADICDRILQVVNKSVSLQELHVSSIGARWEFLARLSQAMAMNPSCCLASLDLSCNFLEDKGLNQLSSVMAKLSHGLRHVNVSYCSLTGKGLSHFASSLASNKLNTSTLTYLNLAGNSLKEESQALCSFLAQPNVVAILDISSTETPLDVLFGALVRGCTTALTHLNLSRNPFSSKKAKEIPAAFKQFFAGTLVLQYLNVSHCKIPPEAVKHLLLGLACNEATANVELNLSCNNLSAPGAAVLESCIGGVKCVSRLDLSENNIDAEMVGVMQGIMKNKSVLSLNVSRNMVGVKPKYLCSVMESIVQLIQDEETVLQKLNLSDCKLKAEINNVINALGSNQCLQHLDISGNLMGDVGARLLAKALQINTRLRIINLDRNGITLQGYTDITYALQSNYAMRHIPFPTYDMQPFVKTHTERVDSIVHRMQELLQRNSSPHRFRNTAQAFRLTQGFLLSSTQQILDRVSVQTQDNIDALLKLNPDKASNEDVVLAKGMIEDAENSKHLLSALHEVTSRGTDVDLKLKQVSLDLSNFVASHVHQNVEAMLSCAEKQCPRVMGQSDSKARAELRTNCQKKCNIPPDFVTTLIMDQLGLEFHNKINELNLIIANHISDRVIDDVIEGMSSKSKSIVSEAGSLRKKRSLTPDVLKGRSSSLSESMEQETVSLASGDATSQKSESSPLGTPQTNKRKSLHGRKLRPKSAADGIHGGSKDDPADGDEDNDTPPSSAFGSAKALGNGDSANAFNDEDTVPELPSTTMLQHLGKARPKRSKRHAPSRGAVVHFNSPGGTAGGEAGDDDGGIHKFYSSSANSSFSPDSTPSSSPMVEESPLPPRTSSFGSRSGNRESSKSDLASTPTGALPLERKEEKRSSLLLGYKRGEDKKPAAAGVGSPEVERSSPGGTKAAATRLGSGLSCLSRATADEESAASESPEKRSLSPSLHSISDFFARKPDFKQASPKPENKLPQTTTSGVSPFATRKTDSEIMTSSHRRSFNPGDDQATAAATTKDDSALSPVDADGKKTPEGVVKRHAGVGHGGNPDLMAEIKEKRASMVPKAATEGDLSPNKSAAAGDSSKSIFSQVKLRSTGLAGSLGSPTSEFASKSDEAEESKGGSIVGLRASKFTSSLTNASASSTASNTATSLQSPTNNASGAGGDSSKPKPLPKPRPWSIVGVDRKSGELTSVGGSDEPSEDSRTALNSGGGGTVSSSAAAAAAAARKSSVRDMINNMNKVGVSAEGTPTEGFVRRKESSLPRNAQPPSGSGDDSGGLSRSPNVSNSPKVAKRSESTNDDPRILKLDDDFAFDDVMDV